MKTVRFRIIALAVLAVLAAISALIAEHHANEAMLDQIRSSDKWSFYQAKSIKSYLYEMQKEKLEMELKALGTKAAQPVLEAYGAGGVDARTTEFATDGLGMDGALDAIHLIADEGWKLLPHYVFEPLTGIWRHRRGRHLRRLIPRLQPTQPVLRSQVALVGDRQRRPRPWPRSSTGRARAPAGSGSPCCCPTSSCCF